MSDQPSQRPEPGPPEPPASSGFEPHRFAAPSDGGTPPQPPYGQGGYGQDGSGQNTYGQGGYASGGSGQNAYGEPGFYRAPYGQQPSPYAQQASPYGQQAYYYGMQPEPKTLSIASMVCGIASVIMGWILIPQVAAIITGHMALKREPAGRGMSIAGLVLGYLCLLGYGAFWLLVIIGLTLASTTGGSTYSF